MDTSDSEHFESADEFDSDGESSDDTREKSIIEDNSAFQKRLDNLNINEHSENISIRGSEKNEANSALNCGDTGGSRTNDLELKKYGEDNQIIPKKNTDSPTGTQVDNTNQDFMANNRVEKFKSKTGDTPEEVKDDCKMSSKSDGSERKAIDQSLVFGSDNMWDNDEWEPISVDSVRVSGDSKTNPAPKNIQENAWDNDDWEPIENKDNEEEWDHINSDKVISNVTINDSSWGAWGTWGVSSIISSATTLTNQVSQGFSNVLENSMGIPDPEELAKQHHNEKLGDLEVLRNIDENSVLEEESVNKNYTGFGFGNLSNLVSGVSNLTKFVEHTGNKVITGGLDTLETIGKKTMEVLQEGDPGLKNKRAFLKLDQHKPVLSQVLKEAKARAEEENKVLQQNNITKKLNYESLFDDHHGLVHLEALEMLSKQCEIKLESISSTCSKEILETLEQVRELCELPDEDDEDQLTLEEIEEKIKSALIDININITYDKGMSTWKEAETWLNSLQLSIIEDSEIHQEALQVLAQLTAIAVEQFHKAGELLLIKEHRSTADEADSLVQLTTALTSLIGIAAGKFSEKLNAKATGSFDKEKINDLITNVFFEAANSSSYIQDAFQLLIPVLQVGAV